MHTAHPRHRCTPSLSLIQSTHTHYLCTSLTLMHITHAHPVTTHTHPADSLHVGLQGAELRLLAAHLEQQPAEGHLRLHQLVVRAHVLQREDAAVHHVLERVHQGGLVADRQTEVKGVREAENGINQGITRKEGLHCTALSSPNSTLLCCTHPGVGVVLAVVGGAVQVERAGHGHGHPLVGADGEELGVDICSAVQDSKVQSDEQIE